MQKLAHAGSSFRESNEKMFTYTQQICINIKVNKTLHKVNLYSVSQRFHNISYTHYKGHHYITITTICHVNYKNRFKIMIIIVTPKQIGSLLTYIYWIKHLYWVMKFSCNESITAVKYFESLQQIFWPFEWEGRSLLMSAPSTHVQTPREISKPVGQQITKQNPSQITDDALNGPYCYTCISCATVN
jgi:hypothetical protein